MSALAKPDDGGQTTSRCNHRQGIHSTHHQPSKQGSLRPVQEKVARGRIRTCASAGTQHAMQRCITKATVIQPSKEHKEMQLFNCAKPRDQEKVAGGRN